MMKSLLAVATLVLTSSASTAFADAKCTVVKVGNKSASENVVVTAKLENTREIFCKTQSKKVAEKFAADNNACEPGKSTFKYTVTWGEKGKENSHELSAYCPKDNIKKK
jgi:hypothetical protein